MGNALEDVDLGLGFLAAGVSCGLDHTCAWTGGGRMKCWGGNEYGQVRRKEGVICGLYFLLFYFILFCFAFFRVFSWPMKHPFICTWDSCSVWTTNTTTVCCFPRIFYPLFFFSLHAFCLVAHETCIVFFHTYVGFFLCMEYVVVSRFFILFPRRGLSAYCCAMRGNQVRAVALLTARFLVAPLVLTDFFLFCQLHGNCFAALTCFW